MIADFELARSSIRRLQLGYRVIGGISSWCCEVNSWGSSMEIAIQLPGCPGRGLSDLGHVLSLQQTLIAGFPDS